MKQRVGGGLFAGLVCIVAAACGGTEADAGSAGEPSTTPMAGMSSPPSTSAGSPASGGSRAPAAGGTGGTGTTTNPVSSAAGSMAAAGSAASASATAGMSASGAGSNSPAAAGSTAAAGSAASGGCGTESFKAIYDSVFKNMANNCTGPVCHGREPAMAMPVGNLSLSSASIAYMQLVKVDSTSMACTGKPRVVPGDAAGSLLVQKLRGATTMCGGVMPVGAEEIPEADLKRITDWINAGACDN